MRDTIVDHKTICIVDVLILNLWSFCKNRRVFYDFFFFFFECIASPVDKFLFTTTTSPLT